MLHYPRDIITKMTVEILTLLLSIGTIVATRSYIRKIFVAVLWQLYDFLLWTEQKM